MQNGQILDAPLQIRRFEDPRYPAEVRLCEQPPESLEPDEPITDIGVSISPAAARARGIVGVDKCETIESDFSVQRHHQVLRRSFLREVPARGEEMSRIEGNPQTIAAPAKTDQDTQLREVGSDHPTWSGAVLQQELDTRE
jgi:hypothetical protein